MPVEELGVSALAHGVQPSSTSCRSFWVVELVTVGVVGLEFPPQ